MNEIIGNKTDTELTFGAGEAKHDLQRIHCVLIDVKFVFKTFPLTISQPHVFVSKISLKPLNRYE